MQNDDEPQGSPGAHDRKPPEKPAEKLDLERLDLEVEEVEQRITPSETNVFDK